MLKKIFVIVAVVFAVYPFNSGFGEGLYPPSSEVVRTDLSHGEWLGHHVFHDVYCVEFPEPENAVGMNEQAYKGNAINLVRVIYKDNIMINIVASTLPEGRSASEEIERLHEMEKRSEEAYQHNYNISLTQGKFGSVIGLRIKNVAPAGSDAVFPLVRPLYQTAEESIRSMSAHRLFVRGADRFEIAVFQAAPSQPDRHAEREMTHRVTKLADETLQAFEECTSLSPLRLVNRGNT